MPFEPIHEYGKTSCPLPKRLTDGPTFYYVNFEKLNADIHKYIDANFFKPVVQNKSTIKQCGLILPFKIRNQYLQIVEKLEITQKDLEEQPLLMPFHCKLHDVYTGEIIFDDGYDVFEDADKAQVAYDEWIAEQLKDLAEKVVKIFIQPLDT